MESKKYLIVTSDGPGTLLEGKDVLHRSIARFVSVFPDIKVIIVLPSAAISAWREYCMLHNFNHPQTVVPAGFTAFHSIRKALEKVPSGSLVVRGAGPAAVYPLPGTGCGHRSGRPCRRQRQADPGGSRPRRCMSWRAVERGPAAPGISFGCHPGGVCATVRYHLHGPCFGGGGP